MGPNCPRISFPSGKLSQYRSEIIQRGGRTHFPAFPNYNFNWGIEEVKRFAYRVANNIHDKILTT